MMVREIQSEGSLNFMIIIIRITYPNLLHGSDVILLFSPDELSNEFEKDSS